MLVYQISVCESSYVITELSCYHRLLSANENSYKFSQL